ncbi:MAG: aspartate dehydrogenase [Hungatella sp.]|nr:aspartate dehydrogenase [Hungatella sp.]
MFGKKKRTGSYDRDNQVPVIRASICTGEKVAGFKDVHTGKFKEEMVVRSDRDMQEFLRFYGISSEEIRKEW